MVSEATSIRKNSAIEECARKACEIIEKYDYLFESDIETFEQRNKRKLIENDYYDDDDDAFYDRSGQIENKRSKRMERLGTRDSCTEVLNFEKLVLKAKLDLVQKDILAVFQKISQQQVEIGGDEEEDELDSYMKKIQLEIDQKVLNQYQNELNNLRKEEEEIIKILPKLEPLKLGEEKSTLYSTFN
ncbi:hypothetical protein MXB_4250 [Myxobolus squamalis]|nr:hypothetical protein MXB_4250 [Myxobolus squamalis]